MSNTRLQSKPLLRQKPMVEWKDTNWRKLERVVFKLQKRIYRATQRGDVKAVRKLQKTLMRSWSAKCLAVRKVTQDNQGKKTAGVDGVKSLTPIQRLELVSKLSLNRKVKPTRRVWIPKPGSEEKRPLGIRYADDFVILHEDLSVVKKCQEVISEWLKGMGLELKPSKTRLTHTFTVC